MTRASTSESISSLRAALEGLQSLVTTQQQKIAALENQEDKNSQNKGPKISNPLNALRSPPIPVFTVKSDDFSSMKIKGFIASVSRGRPFVKK